MLALYLSGEFLIHIPFWLHFYLRSFSYTSHACFNFLSGISYTSKVGFFFFFFFFFLNILGSFSYTSRAGFIFMRGVSQTHPVLALFLSGEFLLHIPFLLYFSRGGGGVGQGLLYRGVCLTHPMLAFFFFFFFLIWGVSLPDPVLASFLCGEFLLHIPYWLYFLSREFLLHIPCLLYFSVGSFSYTSHTGFIFIWGVSLTHPMLAFCVGSFSYTSHAGFL